MLLEVPLHAYISKEESVRRLFALITERRLVWAANSTQGDDEVPEEEPGDAHAPAAAPLLELDSFDEVEIDAEKDKDGEEEAKEKVDGEENDDAGNGDAEEGEEESGGEDDPEIELPSSDSATVHMQSKRDRLASMLDEIRSLQSRLGE